MKFAARKRQRPSAHRAKPTEIRRCAYCGGTFAAEPHSKQIYCTPDVEKRIVYERKRALVDLLTGVFLKQQWWARDMRTVAQRCVYNDAESAWIIAAVRAMGWIYQEKSKRWVRKSGV